MNHLLKYSGIDPAERFNERLMKQMRETVRRARAIFKKTMSSDPKAPIARAGDGAPRAIVAGHGDFAAGSISAVQQITGRGDAARSASPCRTLERRGHRGAVAREDDRRPACT